MPMKPLRPCKSPGCKQLTRSGWCEQHIHQSDRPDRRSAHQRGYGSRWQSERKAYLKQYPWCAECTRNNLATPANEVDHIIPHRGDQQIFWNQDNWQGLCHRCHSRKTAKEDGGFGNRRR